MTRAQQKVFTAIKNFIGTQHCSPTIYDIQKLTGLRSTSTVSKHVHRLARDGAIVLSRYAGGNWDIEISPTRVPGFKQCEQGHEEIFYRGLLCPCCKVISSVARSVLQEPSTTVSE